MKRFLILLLCLVIFLSSCQGTAPTTTTPDSTPVSTPESTVSTDPKQDAAIITPEYQKWINNSKSFFSQIKVTGTSKSDLITGDSHALAWGSSYTLHSIYRAYCATGDQNYLKNLASMLYRIFELMADTDGDGYLNWGASYNINGKSYPYDEYAAHVGIMVSIAGDFVNLIYGDPSLFEKSAHLRLSYKEVTDFIIDRAINHAIPAFEKDWNDELGVYMNRPGCVNYSGATKPIALPNNQYLCMVPALLNFAKICPEKRDEYIYKAEKMLSTFRAHVTFADDGTACWNYKDTLFENDWVTSTEDYSHAMWDIRAAIYGMSSGLVFSVSDLEAMAKTYDVNMFRGTEDNPKLTEYVDGKGNAGGAISLLLFDLGVYGEKIITRGAKALEVSNTTKSRDAGRVLAFHPDTPIPRWFDLTLPANNAENVGSTEGFIWQRKAYANYYTLQIATDADFTNIIVNRDKILESSAIVKDLPASSTLYWRVIANNIAGDKIYSDTFSFKTK